MTRLKTGLLATLLVAGSGNLFAAIYKTIDENGNVVFTDAPQADASPVELSPASTYAPPPTPVSKPATAAEPEADQAQAIYRNIRITAPQAEASIRENSGRVEVQVEMEPDLIDEAGHRLQFFLDGNPIGEASTDLQTSLSNVDRGEHQLEVAVVDFTGTELKRSASVRFYLHRVSILLPGGNPPPARPTPRR